jgi:hypothetical protein
MCATNPDHPSATHILPLSLSLTHTRLLPEKLTYYGRVLKSVNVWFLYVKQQTR